MKSAYSFTVTRFKSKIFKSTLLIVLSTALLAPFTFLKPVITDKMLQENLDKANKKKRALAEKPLHNVDIPEFSNVLDIETKKQAFFDFLKPAIIKQNNRILKTRSKLNNWLEQVSLEQSLTKQEYQEVKALVAKYRVNKEGSTLAQLNALIIRVDIIPASLVLVQAANESAWGTSRFSRIGLNFFGIWCYQSGCGMVPTDRNKNAKHEVAAFQSIDEAVEHYFDNMNAHNAYHAFRTLRFELRSKKQSLDAKVLASGLIPYSERGVDYVMDITEMLNQNKHYFDD